MPHAMERSDATPTMSATQTVDRILDSFDGERQAQARLMLSESLKGVLAQRLLRAREGGRALAMEVLIGTPAVSALIREKKTFQLQSVLQTGRKEGMQTMDEALTVLPALLDRYGLERPVLIGHSDGASIAIIHAGAGYPASALVLIAPHVFVEAETIAGIEAADAAFRAGPLRHRLARHHADVDATFRGWADAWLAPEFRDWFRDRVVEYTELRDEQRRVAKFELVADLDMAGARGAAIAALSVLVHTT